MPNPFSKGWKYLMASFDKSIEDNADPKVQIHQAAEAAKERHRAIQEQAAAVIGNRNQLELTLGRLGAERDKLAEGARGALAQAERARAAGDEARAAELEGTAQALAAQLVTVERELADTAEAHERAGRAAEEAQAQAKRSQEEYRELSGTIRELEAQADQAAMQEQAAAALDGVRDRAKESSAPTLDEVRAKIESRYANALGAQELAEGSADGRMAEVEAGVADARASARLAEIRAELAGGDAPGELTAGEDPAGGGGADRG